MIQSSSSELALAQPPGSPLPLQGSVSPAEPLGGATTVDLSAPSDPEDEEQSEPPGESEEAPEGEPQPESEDGFEAAPDASPEEAAKIAREGESEELTRESDDEDRATLPETRSHIHLLADEAQRLAAAPKAGAPCIVLGFRDTAYHVFSRPAAAAASEEAPAGNPLLFSLAEQPDLAQYLFEGTVASFLRELKDTFEVELDATLVFPRLRLAFAEAISFGETLTVAELFALHAAQEAHDGGDAGAPLLVQLQEQPFQFLKQLAYLHSLLPSARGGAGAAGETPLETFEELEGDDEEAAGEPVVSGVQDVIYIDDDDPDGSVLSVGTGKRPLPVDAGASADAGGSADSAKRLRAASPVP